MFGHTYNAHVDLHNTK